MKIMETKMLSFNRQSIIQSKVVIVLRIEGGIFKRKQEYIVTMGAVADQVSALPQIPKQKVSNNIRLSYRA